MCQNCRLRGDHERTSVALIDVPTKQIKIAVPKGLENDRSAVWRPGMRIFVGISEGQSPDVRKSRILAGWRQISDVHIGMAVHTANCHHFLPVLRGGDLPE